MARCAIRWWSAPRPEVTALHLFQQRMKLATFCQLLDAYAEPPSTSLPRLSSAPSAPIAGGALSRFSARFYAAESLRAFSRDTLPPGEFEKLQGKKSIAAYVMSFAPPTRTAMRGL